MSVVVCVGGYSDPLPVSTPGPSGYEQHPDKKAKFRHSRLHIPDRLPEKYLGKNDFMQERVDGLITDTTFSPFTTVILPYHYMATPDQKIEWNVYTFDEGLASRVPYESAARTLTQRKQTFSVHMCFFFAIVYLFGYAWER